MRVRNISPSGALIEGSIVPEKDEPLVLKRGSFEASARIVWKVGRRAGIEFSSNIHVADWMSRQSSAHQGRTDDMVQAIRSGPGDWPGKSSEQQQASSDCPIETELRTLRSNLAELGDGLIGDVILVATHPEIQLLDIALQSVDRLLSAVRQR